MAMLMDRAMLERIIAFAATGENPEGRYVRAETVRKLILEATADAEVRMAALGVIDLLSTTDGLVDSYKMGFAFGTLSNDPELEPGMMAIFELTRDQHNLPIVRVGDKPVS